MTSGASDPRSLARQIVAESAGTAVLLAAVVGSGFMEERLAGGNVGVALLANTLATGAVRVALVLTFGPSYSVKRASHIGSIEEGRR